MGSERGLRLEGVSLSVGGREFLCDFSLLVESGEVVVFMGPSGSGKSSLLEFLCGALPPPFEARGRIFLDGVEITGFPVHERRVGILFQEDLLFPHLSVGENLGFGLRVARGARAGVIEEALRRVELAGFAARDPGSLSGGQRARVSLMRCLLAEPRVLLLDEPFSKLDVPLRRGIRQLVFREVVERDLPTILVTHDIGDARAAGGRRFAMEKLVKRHK